MTMFKKIIGTLAVCVALTVPLVASAHAAPVQSDPRSSETIETAPDHVDILFSERIDEAASAIKITGPSGDTVSTADARVSASDPRRLTVAMRADGTGTYLVSWSVVSADDGHFTKGAYPFAVGAGTRIDESGAVDTEMVQISTTPEALSIAVELMGNGFILAAILLFIFAVRPLHGQSVFTEHTRLIRRGYLFILFMGALLVFSGAIAQIGIKSNSLADLRAIDFRSAVFLYVHTAAGAATVYRMIAVATVCVVAVIGSVRIINSLRTTAYEWVMIAAMVGFEYFRAVISHATANPFHPNLSVAVNFVHLIEKDFWAGAVGVLLIMMLSTRLWPLFAAMIPRVFALLALDLVAVSVTACYIVWLHLKSFDNLFSTLWGSVFMQLMIAAVILVAIRVYHVCVRLYRPRVFIKYLPVSLAAEFAFAMLVVYCSSVVIITSPPLGGVESHFSARDQGITIVLARDVYEDGMVVLTVAGSDGARTPAVTIGGDAGTSDELSVDLIQRYEGGYVFPAALLSGDGPFEISVTVPQTNGYDAHAQFEVPKSALETTGPDGKRAFDPFTYTMIAIAFASLVSALMVYRFSSRPAHPVGVPPRRAFPEFVVMSMCVLFSFLGASLIAVYGASALSNPYKAACESDGNMWHLMLPSKAGIPVSQTPREGCMWGMGTMAYQFPDRREYDYLSSLGPATADLDTGPAPIRAGTPVDLTFSLKNADGSPATLLVDMEKYIHVVIVSEDENVFAHIHADDLRPIPEADIARSTFSVTYAFPKAGTYLVSIDYAHGTQLESKQFTVRVEGSPRQDVGVHTYPSPGSFGGYDVTMDSNSATAGEVTTLLFTVMKNGKQVTDMQPYLSAVAHISVVKNDLSAFIHTHGEVHAPGAVLAPVVVKDGKVIHSMASMTAPAAFGPKFDAHLVFPTSGRYTVWAQFKNDGVVIPASFTIDVE